jgi:hypothetical protein
MREPSAEAKRYTEFCKTSSTLFPTKVFCIENTHLLLGEVVELVELVEPALKAGWHHLGEVEG